MKKIHLVILSVLFILLLSGCGTNTPKEKVKEFLSRYTSISEDVETNIETSVAKEGLSTTNQNKYKEVLKRQYTNLKYEIKDETTDGDAAVVRVHITVYDLYKSAIQSLDYLNNNNELFYNDDVFNQESYDSYRIDQMLNTKEIIEYDIDFYLTKENGTWIVQNPDNTTQEKIHGLYDYES